MKRKSKKKINLKMYFISNIIISLIVLILLGYLYLFSKKEVGTIPIVVAGLFFGFSFPSTKPNKPLLIASIIPIIIFGRVAIIYNNMYFALPALLSAVAFGIGSPNVMIVEMMIEAGKSYKNIISKALLYILLFPLIGFIIFVAMFGLLSILLTMPILLLIYVLFGGIIVFCFIISYIQTIIILILNKIIK